MGTDKAFVPVEGVAMVRRVVNALCAAGATEVVCVGGDATRLAALGLGSIADRWPGEGPLGGLVTALGWSGEALLVVAGCDQPWLSAPSIQVLVDAHRAADSPVTAYCVDGTVQPLPGVYDTSLGPRLEEAMLHGERALYAVIHSVQPTIVEAADPAMLRDVDTPDDLGRT